MKLLRGIVYLLIIMLGALHLIAGYWLGANDGYDLGYDDALWDQAEIHCDNGA